MSTPTWGLDPKARRISVYYEGTSTIREGMPVCYSYLTKKNWLGVDGSKIDFTTTASTSALENTATAEGNQNEGKFIRVENPAACCDVNGTPATGYKTITGGGTDFTDLQVGMFVTVTGTDITNGTYEITAKAADVITLDMAVATGVTADVTVKKDNLQDFAGVVAGADHDGETGPRAIDIYVPNGAIVPVKTVLTSTVVGRTILCVNAGTQTLGNPTTDIDDYGRDTLGDTVSRPVAIAAETIAAAGLCLAKLDPNVFLYQGGSDDQELQVAAGTVNTAVNKSLIDFKNTDGHCTSWLWRTRLSGAGCGTAKGVYRFDVLADATSYGESSTAMTLNFDVACTASQDLGNFHYRGLDIQMRTQSDPDISEAVITGMNIGLHIRKNAAAEACTEDPLVLSYFRFNTSGEAPTHLWYQTDPGALGDSLSGVDEAAHVVGFDGDGITRKIPIRITGVTYYLLAGTAVANTAD